MPLVPDAKPLGASLFDATLRFAVLASWLHLVLNVLASLLISAGTTFLLTLYLSGARKMKKRDLEKLLPGTEIFALSNLSTIAALKASVEDCEKEEKDNQTGDSLHSWKVIEVPGKKSVFQFEIAEAAKSGGTPKQKLLVTYELEQDGISTRLYSHYRILCLEETSPVLTAGFMRRLGTLRANIAFKIPRTDSNYLDSIYTPTVKILVWSLVLKHFLKDALNVQNLSLRWAFFFLAYTYIGIASILKDFNSKPIWYILVCDLPTIPMFVGVLLYALRAQNRILIGIFSLLGPIFLVSELANLGWEFTHFSEYLIVMGGDSFRTIMTIIMAELLFNILALYANLAFAYRNYYPTKS